ncbi:hypothetical protein I3A86_25395, partial [Salmonella enterica]|nr:hypothetical protein [Salmonella enterica]
MEQRRSSVDNSVASTILGVMLDPAILHDLQRAMVPPSLPPLAIVRTWNSPMAEKAERDLAPILAASEIMVV